MKVPIFIFNFSVLKKVAEEYGERFRHLNSEALLAVSMLDENGPST